MGSVLHIVSASPIAPIVQFSHSIHEWINFSFVILFVIPLHVFLSLPFVHRPSDKLGKQTCKNKQIIHSQYPLQTIQTSKWFFFQLEMSKVSVTGKPLLCI